MKMLWSLFKTGPFPAVCGLGLLLVSASPVLAGGNPDAGKTVFFANCTACHGVNGDGKGPAAGSLSPPPANFTDPAFWKGKTDSFLIHVIQNGMGPMPAWSDTLTPQNIDDVLAYIKTLKK